MTQPWFKEAIVYALDVETFADGNGDGVGDFAGLRARLPYLVDLGVSCLWLTPFYATPNRDNGYDVLDHGAVDPRLGTIADVDAFCAEAHRLGLRVIVDLVANHTSDQHAWFRAARTGLDAPEHDYYQWSDTPEPAETASVFAGDTPASVWTFVPEVGAYYRHQFYPFQPDLCTGHPVVQEYIRRTVRFWLDRGMDGFRIDAARHLGARMDDGRVQQGDPHEILRMIRSCADASRADAALMAEVDLSGAELATYFGSEAGPEMHALLDFVLNRFVFLALSRGRAEPIVRGLSMLPERPDGGQWANYLRTFDEVDLEHFEPPERAEMEDAYAPEEEMRIFGRGIRRRLAPMLGGDGSRLRLAFSLLLTLPGTPIIPYGDEIEMGDDLSLPGRDAIRTPMQWEAGPTAGFSDASRSDLVRPTIATGPYAAERVSVADQRADAGSLLNWISRAIRDRRACAQFGWAPCRVVDGGDERILALRYDAGPDSLLAVHNLADRTATTTLPDGQWSVVFDTHGDETNAIGGDCAKLPAFGGRWFRLAISAG